MDGLCLSSQLLWQMVKRFNVRNDVPCGFMEWRRNEMSRHHLLKERCHNLINFTRSLLSHFIK